MMESIEYLPHVSSQGTVIGKITRTEAHNGSFLLHPVVHLHVFNSRGELYLQKRSMSKLIQPGKWDTAVGGHVDYGETIEQALMRETAEELGIIPAEYHIISSYRFTSDVESELVYVFVTCYDDIITPNPDEISEGAFWNIETLTEKLHTGIFTPNFEQEFDKVLEPYMRSTKDI